MGFLGVAGANRDDGGDPEGMVRLDTQRERSFSCTEAITADDLDRRVPEEALSSGYLQNYRPNAWADSRHVAKEGAAPCLNRGFPVPRCP